MAQFFHSLGKSSLFHSSFLSSETLLCLPLIRGMQHHSSQGSLVAAAPFLCHTRRIHNSGRTKSLFESNIIRILRNEIQYQLEYAPPHEPVMKFNTFVVQDQPGEQCITLSGKFGENEYIKIEATMFDGCVFVPRLDEDSTGENTRLHISLLVDINKGVGHNRMGFICSAWPECLEIQKVIIDRHRRMMAKPYMGSDFRNLDDKLQDAVRQFLEIRAVNNQLSGFLHEYMANKDKTELIRWLRNVKSFVEK